MIVPAWIVNKRVQICLACYQRNGCVAKLQIASHEPTCPLGALPSAADEIAARAWPAGAQPVSGCCDSAENYLSQTPR